MAAVQSALATLTTQWPVVVTLALAGGYLLKQWVWPARATRQHAYMRQAWLEGVSAAPGTEVLGVQTIRNALMSCTLTATTATLSFMGGISWLYRDQMVADAPIALHLLAVLALLALSLMACMLSARHWQHASFVAGMPVGSAVRTTWLPQGQRSLQRAGRYYALSVRLLLWCIPVLLTGLNAVWGLAAAVVVLLVLACGMDR